MIIELDLQSDMPIYTQLVNQIIEGIATKRLQMGEALPSIRSMAADLGINLHTVNKAYTLLKQDGFIQIHRQRGVVVSNVLPQSDQAYLQKLHEQLRSIVAESICRGLTQDQLFVESGKVYQTMQAGGISNE